LSAESKFVKRVVDEFLDDLQRAVGCITRQQLWVAHNRYDPNLRHTITFGRNAEPVPLRGYSGPTGLQFDLLHQYRITNDAPGQPDLGWRVSTMQYEYRILDHTERELLVYHWQPGTDNSGPDHPHIHISGTLQGMRSATERLEIPLDKLHIPTGRVSIEAVIRMLITEFGVRPLREDWEKRLNETESRFHERRRRDDW